MSRMMCFLLACTMALATVMGMDPEPGAPQWGIEYQCQNRGYAGACISQNQFKGELTCFSLACAVWDNGGYHRAEPTGPVDDGTLCGLNRICQRGVCVPQKPTDIMFPMGNDPRFYCVSSPVVRISGYPPHSNPKRNRPAIELLSERSGHTVRMEIPSPGAIRRSRPVASTSTGGQRSAPAASRPRGRPRLTPAASTSTSGQRSAPAASTSTGGQHSALPAMTSTGTQTSWSPPYTYERRH